MPFSFGDIGTIQDEPTWIDYHICLRLDKRSIVAWHEMMAKDEDEDVKEWISIAILDDSGELYNYGSIIKGADPVVYARKDEFFLVSQELIHVNGDSNVHKITLSELQLQRQSARKPSIRKLTSWNVQGLSSHLQPFSAEGAHGFGYLRKESSGNYKIELAYWDQSNEVMTCPIIESPSRIFDWSLLIGTEDNIVIWTDTHSLRFQRVTKSGELLGEQRDINVSWDIEKVHSRQSRVGRFSAALANSHEIMILAEFKAEAFFNTPPESLPDLAHFLGSDHRMLLATSKQDISNGSSGPWQLISTNGILPEILNTGEHILFGFTGGWTALPSEWRTTRSASGQEAELVKELFRVVRSRKEKELFREELPGPPINSFPSVWIGRLDPDAKPMEDPMRIQTDWRDSWDTDFAVAGSKGHVIWRNGADQKHCCIQYRTVSIS